MSGRADPVRDALRLTRRRLLGGMSAVALTPTLAGCWSPPKDGRPWSDETFFSDGTGWLEEEAG